MIVGSAANLWEPETYDAYIRRIGPPRTAPCHIDLGMGRNTVWYCFTHELGYNTERRHLLDGQLDDHCPVSRLEAWRARRWEAAA